MHNNKNTQPPILSKFVRREFDGDRKGHADIVSYELRVIETNSSGYNPYDRSPPPTEAQLEEHTRRGLFRGRKR